MKVEVCIRKSAVVPDSPPFAVYGLEVRTECSRAVLPKRFSEFYEFQTQLCYFAHFPLGDGRCLLDIVPRLPSADWSNSPLLPFTEVSFTQRRKSDLEKYMQAVAALLPAKHQPWAPLLEDFLQVPRILLREKVSARLIQTAYRRHKQRLLQRAAAKERFRELGYVTCLNVLDDFLLTDVLSFLCINELSRCALVCRRWHSLTSKPILWQTLSMFPKFLGVSSTAVETICQRAWSLSVIDLRYCQNVDASTLMSISQCCNPQCLKELHLDGCEKVDDVALTNLVSKFLDTTQHCWTDVPKLKGGARGLWKLSISECRLVTDQGVGVLRKLKQLADLSILGCYSVTDEGLRHLLRGSKCFKQLNLSGTYITPETLLLIRSTCRDLQSLVLNGCKQLRQDNKDLFPTHVKVDLRDDVFRFQLAPVPGSALQPITSNILRTRGSLAIQRVCHYVLKKLEKDDVAIDVLCKDRVLTPYQTLKEVSRDLWDGGILLLHYQLREETRASEESHLRNCALFRVVKWVPNQLAPLCRSCEEPFSFLTRRHHCRRCGLVFCSKCSDYWRLLPDLGYSTAPVRVCAACR